MLRVHVVAVFLFVGACSRSTSETPEARRPLAPLTVRSSRFLFPPGARVDTRFPEPDGSIRITWERSRSEGTRCGERAEAQLTYRPSLLPPSFWNCGRHNSFAGGSSDGDCPESNVCVAAIVGIQMVCVSDDDSCLSVSAAFAARGERPSAR